MVSVVGEFLDDLLQMEGIGVDVVIVRMLAGRCSQDFLLKRKLIKGSVSNATSKGKGRTYPKIGKIFLYTYSGFNKKRC